MRTFLLASAAALSLGLGAPALVAQDTATTVTLNVDQQGLYQGWPVERRTSYDAWPAPYRGYFWTLTPSQQTAWWALNDEQRTQVFVMTPDQRVSAWAAIEAQLAGAQVVPASPAVVDAASPAAAGATSATVVSNALPPPPPESLNKTYPVCTRTLRDSCRNPGGK